MEEPTADELRFRLPSGARTAIRAFPCNSRGIRGFPISTLVMDEAAHFQDATEGPAVAEHVWEAAVPATAQFGDAARIIMASTPYGTDGLFAQLYQQALSGELPDARAHHATTADINPTITADFLAQEEARDPDAFRGEYLASFEGSGAAFLDFERFELVDAGSLNPEVGERWIAGLDPAFSRDPFGIAIVGRAKGDKSTLLVGHIDAHKAARHGGAFEERRNAEDELLAVVAADCLRYGARAVTDQHASKAVTDKLSRAGVHCRVENMTASTKTAIYVAMRATLYDGTLQCPNDPRLVSELRRLRTKFTAGSSSVVTPRVGGSHGDIAQALAMAVHEHVRLGRPSGAKPKMGGQTITRHLTPGRGFGSTLADTDFARAGQ